MSKPGNCNDCDHGLESVLAGKVLKRQKLLSLFCKHSQMQIRHNSFGEDLHVLSSLLSSNVNYLKILFTILYCLILFHYILANTVTAIVPEIFSFRARVEMSSGRFRSMGNRLSTIGDIFKCQFPFCGVSAIYSHLDVANDLDRCCEDAPSAQTLSKTKLVNRGWIFNFKNIYYWYIICFLVKAFFLKHKVEC